MMPIILHSNPSNHVNVWHQLQEVKISPTISLIACALIVLTLILGVWRDYQKFLALGPGGTPSTFAGYLRVSYLRLYALSDPFQPPTLAFACLPDKGYLHDLAKRSAPRPQTQGIAPHRQTNQRCNAQLHQTIRNALHFLADANPASLKKGNSCFEKNGLALFLSPSKSCSGRRGSHLNPTCADTGEICHLHPSVRSYRIEFCPFRTIQSVD